MGESARGGDVVEGVLLTVDHATVGGRACLRLWVKDAATGQVASFLDADVAPHFWVVPAEDADAAEVARRLAGLRSGDATPAATEIVERSWDNRPRACVRVVLRHPGHAPALREVAEGVEGVAEVTEADVPFASRYLIDRGLAPLDGVRFRARRDARAREPLVADVARVPRDEHPDLRVLAFHVEVRSPDVAPDPERDAIVVVAVATSSGRVDVLTAGDAPGPAGAAAESDLVRRFVRLLADEDPDVVVTYDGDGFDWPRLVERARVLGVGLDVGRPAGGADEAARASAPSVRHVAGGAVVAIAGRASVDLARVANRELPDVKAKTLVNIADALGVMAADERAHVARDRVAACWDDPAERPALLAHARDDAVATLGLARALLPGQVELARMLGQPLEDVARMGRGRQVEFLLLREAHARGVIAPNRGGQEVEVYEGGFVLEPAAGLHENVVALDFSAMYPSIMVGYNVSPDTLVGGTGAGADGTAVHVAPEVGHRFRVAPEGFFTGIIRDLVKRRRALKDRMRGLTGPARELANVRQGSMKVLTNAFYGYMGWAQARWYSRECAEATAAWGRHLIRTVMDRARSRGIEVLYGDTDSLFVRDHPALADLARDVSRDFPLELDVQERYEVLLLTGAKKRYAGLTTAGEIVVRGLEARRGDWCELAKRVQSDVLDLVLRRRDPAAATAHARAVVADLRAGRVPVEDLAIAKALTMAPAHYRARQAHVAAVERAEAENPGFRVPVGAKVRYVVLAARPARRGPGAGGASRPATAPSPGAAAAGPARGRGADPDSLVERTKLVDLLAPGDEVDVEYYVVKQVVPAAHRILEHFGVTTEEILGAPRQTSLSSFGG